MLKERARGTELLDGPDCDAQLARSSYQFMKLANGPGGGSRVVLDFLSDEAARWSDESELRILDIGAGAADIPLAIYQWARAHQRAIHITCIDQNRQALDVARETIASVPEAPITLERADIHTYEPSRSFDYALASMVFHHFTGDQIRAVVDHLAQFVHKALLVNDLRRCALNYLTCRATASLFASAVRHDALLSIKRGFTVDELTKVLAASPGHATVKTTWFCRVVGIVRFNAEGAA